MNTTPRTVTLATLDAGEVTLPEPSWCAGHADHRPDTYRVDLSHDSEPTVLTLDGYPAGELMISQAPFSEAGPRSPRGFLALSYGQDRPRDPAELYDLAAVLESHADALRALADRLHAILSGSER
ncbi:hypothetical protein ABTX35_39075 [Streptomyces sp. NPDC096080]|uniref:DUF6907 domain-containing protein n=1 Tax=Streptomyces sp. NPDC096080 TaxID=3156693 RepID=UPI00332ADE95